MPLFYRRPVTSQAEFTLNENAQWKTRSFAMHSDDLAVRVELAWANIEPEAAAAGHQSLS